MEDIARLLANLIRVGNVAEVDCAHPSRVRVAIGDLTTNWLRWLELRAGDTRTWSPLTVGEQVVVLAPEGDLSAGIVLAGLPSDERPAPSSNPDAIVTTHKDGTRHEHDAAAGHLATTGLKTRLLQASDSITLKAPLITLDADQVVSTGKHTVEGLLTYLAGMSGQGGKGGSTRISGEFRHSGGELSSNGVVLHIHVHGGVRSGDSDTEKPR